MISKSPIERWGQLSVRSGKICDAYGNPIALRGMSLFWSQWIGKYYNRNVVDWLYSDWKCIAIRAALAVNYGGYRTNPQPELAKLLSVVDSAIERGLYVVVDWHAHEDERSDAARFFGELSRRYPNQPNIIYEIWNEPYPNFTWNKDIKPYHQFVIPHIREYSADNIICVGTENYSQRVDVSAEDPLEFDNIVYSLHYYAASHGAGLRNRALRALRQGLPLLVTEYGLCESTGDGRLDFDEARRWWDFLEEHQIGSFNWSIADKEEAAAALFPGSAADGGWSEGELTESGRAVRNYLRSFSTNKSLYQSDTNI